MRIRISLAAFALAIAFMPLTGLCQNPSLSGVIKDKFSRQAISSAQVKIDASHSTVSGTDGKYLIACPATGVVTVTYTRAGYGPQSDKVTLSSGATSHNVELINDTTSDLVWMANAQSLLISTAGLPDRATAITDAWQQIDSAALPPETKAAAARQFATVFPHNAIPPSSLQAYQTVTPLDLSRALFNFQQAVATNHTISGAATLLPAPVAADIAAQQITDFQMKTGNVASPEFYSNFSQSYGKNATDRMSAAVQLQTAARIQF